MSLRALVTLFVLSAPLAWDVTPAVAQPEVVVHLGLDGLARAQRPVSIRLELDNPGEAWSGTVALGEVREGLVPLRWELPLELAAGARQVRFLTVHPVFLATFSGQTGFAWSLQGPKAGAREWTPVLPDVDFVGTSALLFVAVSDEGTGFPALRQLFDPVGNQDIRTAVLQPEHAPREAAAWEAADVIVVDLAVADRLRAEVWEAIAARVSLGATFVLHGSGRRPPEVPEMLIAGRPVAGGGAGDWVEPLSERRLPALPLELLPGAVRPTNGNAELSWGARRPLGLGTVVSSGVDLRGLQAPLETQAETWKSLLGTSRSSEIRSKTQFVEQLQGGGQLQRRFSRGGLQVVDASLAAVLVLGLLGVAVLRRRPSWRDRSGLLVPVGALALSAPLVLAGMASRVVEDETPFVIEEHFADSGLLRRTSMLEFMGAGRAVPRTRLPGWPMRPYPENELAFTGLGDASIEWGAEPTARGFRVPMGAALGFRCESWSTANPPFEVEGGGPGQPSSVRNVSLDDLDAVYLLDDGDVWTVGDLAVGESGRARRGVKDRDAPAVAALRDLNSRRVEGPIVAAEVGAGSRGLLSRSTSRILVQFPGPERR